MIEKRRCKRLPFNMKLSISDLFNCKNTGLKCLDLPIEIIDISKMGFGFISEGILPIDYYFNAQLNFEKTDSPFTSVVKIIHNSPIDKSFYRYGVEFKNLSEENTLLLQNCVLNLE